jgi:hypothetical protein
VAGIAAGSQELVGVHTEHSCQVDEPVAVGGDELGNPNASGLGGTDVLDRVIVGPRLDAHLSAAVPVMSCERVHVDELQRMSQVGGAVHVRDRGGDVQVVHCRPPLIGRSEGHLLRQRGRSTARPPHRGGLALGVRADYAPGRRRIIRAAHVKRMPSLSAYGRTRSNK